MPHIGILALKLHRKLCVRLSFKYEQIIVSNGYIMAYYYELHRCYHKKPLNTHRMTDYELTTLGLFEYLACHLKDTCALQIKKLVWLSVSSAAIMKNNMCAI